MYTSSLHHLLSELARIDLLIQGQVWRARQMQGTDDEFQGLYISEQELDALLAQPVGLPKWATEEAPLSLEELRLALTRMSEEIAARKAESARQGVDLRLERLADYFHITPFELDVLLICLATELDLRYEKLYAYLQDDVTKKRPSVDLVLNLLCPSFAAKVAARQHFDAAAPLLKNHLLQLCTDPTQPQPSLLNKFLKADDRVVNYLLDSDSVDARLTSFVTCVVPTTTLDALCLPTEVKARLLALTQHEQTKTQGFVLYFQGDEGVGKQSTAEAFACALGRKLLVVNGARLVQMMQIGGLQFPEIFDIILREARLQMAPLFWSDFDALLADDKEIWRIALWQTLNPHRLVTILAGSIPWEPSNAFTALPFIRIIFSTPTYPARVQLWTRTLHSLSVAGAAHDQAATVSYAFTSEEIHALANQFHLTGGQIEDAAITACNLARWRNPAMIEITLADLAMACRLHSNRKLTELAQKITPQYGWDDIVLAKEHLQQLREICSYVKYRSTVYDSWGFDGKLALGKGLNVLFAGPSGTGKTMSADIMAGDLGLDLYKIDLSGVVSKYIGETEKNLARIFTEAERSNTILFFDEADALFGKRSEVRDAHDRYANVEISYLLQRMEEYTGIVILATNLRKNMDDAFVRRLHFTIEFPLPSAKDRRRIWEKIWPVATPRSADVDLDFLAQRFDLTGGNIRNIALAAAFLAADDGEVVTMAHLIRATQREYQKMGKIMVEGEFGIYAGLARRRS